MRRESVNPWDYAAWIAEAGTRPPQSLLGVQRLFLPELMVEIEAFAAE